MSKQSLTEKEIAWVKKRYAEEVKWDEKLEVGLLTIVGIFCVSLIVSGASIISGADANTAFFGTLLFVFIIGGVSFFGDM